MALTVALGVSLVRGIPLASIFPAEPGMCPYPSHDPDCLLAQIVATIFLPALTLAILTLIPLRLLLGRDFRDFRLALVQVRPEDETAFAATGWNWGFPILAVVVIATTVIRAAWRGNPEFFVVLFGVSAGIAVTVGVVRYFLLDKSESPSNQNSSRSLD